MNTDVYNDIELLRNGHFCGYRGGYGLTRAANRRRAKNNQSKFASTTEEEFNLSTDFENRK